jgi:uncharacterized protein YciI
MTEEAWMKRRSVLALAAAAAAAPSISAAADAPPKRYFVLTHAPGPAWDHAKGFRDQPGLAQHLGYMQRYFDAGKIVLGGPFLDDSGGMMIFDLGAIDEAREIAAADPTVKAGLLTVTVKPWLAAFAR